MNDSLHASVEDKLSAGAGYKLYTTAQIGIACFFGTPLTSLIMIALNFKAAGQKRSYKIALALAGVLFPFLLMFLNELADRSSYRILIFFIALVMAYPAKVWQSKIYQKHIQNKGERKSAWQVIDVIIFGVSVIFCGLIVFGLLLETELG